MSYIIPPALHAILADADKVAPGRSHASDGTIGDTRHMAQGSKSDHNPDPKTGIVHAVDVTNDPSHGMDTWHWAQIIAGRMVAGIEKRVKYLVSNNGNHDVIFNRAVGDYWRLNGTVNEHTNHLHTSILYTSTAENDVSPYFVDPNLVPTKPIDQVSMEPMDVIWYVGQLHSFWIDVHGHLQHSYDPGGSECLQTRPGNPVAPAESLSVKHGVKCIVNPKTLNLEVHTVERVKNAQIIFLSNSKGQWTAVRIDPK